MRWPKEGSGSHTHNFRFASVSSSFASCGQIEHHFRLYLFRAAKASCLASQYRTMHLLKLCLPPDVGSETSLNWRCADASKSLCKLPWAVITGRGVNHAALFVWTFPSSWSPGMGIHGDEQGHGV